MYRYTAILNIILILILSGCGNDNTDIESYYPVTPVKFTEVKVNDNYWAPRIETNRTVTIPFALQKNEETGRMDNFRKAAGILDGPHQGRRFNDTDVYKVLEGVAYSLAVHPDDELEKYADSLIAIIGKAQEDDGYLMTGRTIDPENPAPGLGSERWIHLQGSHELYNSGHLYEAAVAYYEATGKTNFLDIAVKNADLLLDTFGPGKKQDAPGHQVIEMGLAKLYRATGNREYLDLAKFFLDQRGKPHEREPYPEDSPFAIYNGDLYMQDHKPVKEQSEAWGHAVRATYMYAGMADIAALTGDEEYREAIDRIWENVVSKKMYLTGGVGSRHTSEAFGEDYELPNAEAYNETCAAIGNAFWNHRMFLSSASAEYIDVLERTMYNGLISGVSLSGNLFFYTNPLESHGGYGRSPWFEVSCCPGNIVRFLPSVPGYIYAKQNNKFYVNLYVQSEVETKVNGKTFRLKQLTEYPWDGKVEITVFPGTGRNMTIMLRIPGWMYNKPVPSDLYYFNDPGDADWSVEINGKDYKGIITNGYIAVEREWKDGDIISLNLPMTVHRVKANENVETDRDKVALQRGPVVWCIEGIDNPQGVFNTVIPESAEFNFIKGPGIPYERGIIQGMVKDTSGNDVVLTAVPYAFWANRESGEMAVWMRSD
jgi:DUF1680 family protein